MKVRKQLYEQSKTGGDNASGVSKRARPATFTESHGHHRSGYPSSAFSNWLYSPCSSYDDLVAHGRRASLRGV